VESGHWFTQEVVTTLEKWPMGGPGFAQQFGDDAMTGGIAGAELLRRSDYWAIVGALRVLASQNGA